MCVGRWVGKWGSGTVLDGWMDMYILGTGVVRGMDVVCVCTWCSMCGCGCARSVASGVNC